MNGRRLTPSVGALIVAFWLCITTSALAARESESEQAVHPDALAQIQTILSEKAARSPVENKLDSNLLYGMRALQQRRFGQLRIEPAYVESFMQEHVAADETVQVSIQAKVSDGLLASLAAAGARDVNALAA